MIKKVLLIGTIPPPIGGVSVHLQRFFDNYHNHKELELELLDLKKRYLLPANKKVSIWEIIQLINNASLIHLHLSSNLKILVAMYAKIVGKKVVYTHHNIRIKNEFLFHLMMLFIDRLILVNDQNINVRIKKYNYSLIPAFLPSVEKEKLPYKLINKLKNFKTVLSTNGFRLTFINNKDLYGFDLCIDAFKSLVKKEKIDNTLLVIVDPSGTSQEYIKKLINGFKFKNNCEILFIGYSINFNALIQSSTVVLRITRSDGDSLTVREALYLKTPIIASDVTVRPKGVLYCKHDNSVDLERVLLDVIDKKQKSHSSYEDFNYAQLIFNIYREELILKNIKK